MSHNHRQLAELDYLSCIKDRLLRPNRTHAEIEANRAKHGIVYRDR